MLTARDAMNHLFREGRELDAREHTPEEANTLRARAPAIIEAACQEQYLETESVLTPAYCMICKGCPIFTGLSKI